MGEAMMIKVKEIKKSFFIFFFVFIIIDMIVINIGANNYVRVI